MLALARNSIKSLCFLLVLGLRAAEVHFIFSGLRARTFLVEGFVVTSYIEFLDRRVDGAGLFK